MIPPVNRDLLDDDEDLRAEQRPEWFVGLSRAEVNKAKRRARMANARALGTHTEEEWLWLVELCGSKCIICKGSSGLLKVEKDHVVPVYQDGSDAIENIQPACARCNAHKGPENIDYVPAKVRLIMKEGLK